MKKLILLLAPLSPSIARAGDITFVASIFTGALATFGLSTGNGNSKNKDKEKPKA